jgi:hypothetical protein
MVGRRWSWPIRKRIIKGTGEGRTYIREDVARKGQEAMLRLAAFGGDWTEKP